jgi:hypothetical protein
VPGFFFKPFVFAFKVCWFTRTSQVGGNSTGHGSGLGR